MAQADTISPAERARYNALLRALAEVFAAEGCAGGDAAAAALESCLERPYAGLDEDDQLDDTLATALAHTKALPIVTEIRAAEGLIPWHYSGLADGRIPGPIASRMITSYLIGPESPIDHPTVRVGLFLQSPELAYESRQHVAEETFYVISGTGEWQVGDQDFVTLGPGSYVHHPSLVPHASRTGGEAVLTAWRWTGGNISTRTYTYTG